jgi:hypothetical protein
MRSLLVASLVGTILSLAACGGSVSTDEGETAPRAPTESQAETEAAATTAEVSPEAIEIAAIAESWYSAADPAVCERMTAEFLRTAWDAAGARGVKACREAIGGADPVEDVVVEDVVVEERTARARVVYTLEGARRSDGIAFIRQDGEWLIAEITDTRDEEEAA